MDEVGECEVMLTEHGRAIAQVIFERLEPTRDVFALVSTWECRVHNGVPSVVYETWRERRLQDLPDGYGHATKGEYCSKLRAAIPIEMLNASPLSVDDVMTLNPLTMDAIKNGIPDTTHCE